MPKIFETSSADFIDQVELRITILRAWALQKIPVRKTLDGKSVRDDDGEEDFEYAPCKGLQDFCDWTAELNSPSIIDEEYCFEGKTAAIRSLKPIGRSTLNQKTPVHTALRNRSRTAMSLAQARRLLQIKSDNKKSRIHELEEKVKFLEGLADTQEIEARELRFQLSDQLSEHTNERRKDKNNIARLIEEKAKLEERISELVKTIAKIGSIGVVSGKQ